MAPLGVILEQNNMMCAKSSFCNVFELRPSTTFLASATQGLVEYCFYHNVVLKGLLTPMMAESERRGRKVDIVIICVEYNTLHSATQW